jgi:hypothetical protein
VLDTKGIDPAVQMGTLEALLTGEQYDVVASRLWCETEEFHGQGDPETLALFLLEFADLARQANRRGERLYCWIRL